MLRLASASLVAAGIVVCAQGLHESPAYGRSASFAVLSGAAFGVVLQRSRFCFASAFRDLFLLRDRRTALGVLAALAAGSVGYQVVFGAWVPDPRAGFLPPSAHIGPASWHLLLGGTAFGVGMVLAGGCISGNLYRLGEGSLASLPALLGTVAGFWAGQACWNFFYLRTVATAPVVWLPQRLGYGGSLAVQLAALGLLAALLLRFLPPSATRPPQAVTLTVALRRAFVEGWPAWLGGVAIGVLGTFTLLRTTPLGVTSELSRLARRSAVALGIGPARLEGLESLKGCRPLDSSAPLTDNGFFVLALVAGSLCAALLAGEFRLRAGRPRSHVLALLGGVLLGFGAMISLGCTVGTLLSGVMAFSLSGWVFMGGLLGGAWAGGLVLQRLAGADRERTIDVRGDPCALPALRVEKLLAEDASRLPFTVVGDHLPALEPLQLLAVRHGWTVEFGQEEGGYWRASFRPQR